MIQRLLYLLTRLGKIFTARKEPQVPILKDFDAVRYLGFWYEIKRLDHIFERGVSEARAEYTALADGEFLVTNTGIKNGEEQRFVAVAKPTAIKNYFKIAPRSFPFIRADYRVAWVDDNYQYAIVTGGSLDYLWFLARSREIPGRIMQQMLAISKQLGFDTDKML